jgi:putative ABC transport system permease protein
MTLVTREAALASATGGLAGLVAGAWLSKSLASLLFGVEPADPASIAFAAVLLVLIVVGAAWVPTRRALRLSPAEALRVE